VKSGVPGPTLGKARRQKRQLSVAWGLVFLLQASEGSPRASVQLQEGLEVGAKPRDATAVRQTSDPKASYAGLRRSRSMKKTGSVDRGVPEAGKGLPADALVGAAHGRVSRMGGIVDAHLLGVGSAAVSWPLSAVTSISL